MSELKGLASQDPMKSAQDRASYDNEFKDLQVQLYDISHDEVQWCEYVCQSQTNANDVNTSTQIFLMPRIRILNDNTLTIYTSADGAQGSQVSIYKSALLSALTVKQDQTGR